MRRIESASRFNSQIPLEYAYGSWDLLPEPKRDRRTLQPFLQVTEAQVRAFAGHRVRALAHIEGSFRLKARFIDKPALHLPVVAGLGGEAPTLQRGLMDFLYMEHHASLQNKLLTYNLSIERRAQTGLALLLRYAGPGGAPDVHRFAVEVDAIGLDFELTMNALRLKEGSWVVINVVNEKLSPGRFKNGRLAIIRSIEDDVFTLELLGATFYRDQFRYPHNKKLEPETGALYTLDEMADDMNADKQLAALGESGANTLYRWLVDRPDPYQVRPKIADFFSNFPAAVDQRMGKGRKLTKPQRRVIAESFSEPLLLVQGPPGTGKIYALLGSAGTPRSRSRRGPVNARRGGLQDAQRNQHCAWGHRGAVASGLWYRAAAARWERNGIREGVQDRQ